MKTIFTGFSTVGSTQKKNFKLYDIEIIKQDLMNHFHTRVGERVMRPLYGCRIWDYLMEPFTEMIREATVVEVTRICNAEPRVNMVETLVTSYEHGLRVEVLLDYIPFNKVDQFVIDFETRQSEGF